MSELCGKTALVTGAARRVGREIALALAGEGVHALVHYGTSEADAKETASLCRERGVRAETVQADLSDLADVRRLGDAALRAEVDVLVHNASRFRRVPFEAMPEEHAAALARDLRLHVEAPYLLARLLADRFLEMGWGRIVLVGDASTEGRVFRNHAPYLASKGATPTLARVLALELGSRAPGITANAILPGPLLPPSEGTVPSEEWLRRETFAGRWLGAEPVARAVVFLASSGDITGESLRIDGGRNLHRD